MRPRRASNVDRGRAAKSAGDSFESWVDRQHQKAGLLGLLVHVEHNQAQSRVVHGKLIFVSAGVSDYTGVLYGGRVLAAEAKSRKGDHLPRSAIERRQVEHLDMTAKAGGLAVLLVELRKGDVKQRYAVLWTEVPWKVAKTAERVSVVDLEKYVIADGQCYLERFDLIRGEPVNLGRQRVYPRE